MLVILAVPPILSNTYAGHRGSGPGRPGRGPRHGHDRAGVLLKVELPVALPLIISGLRSAYLQVVATATIAAVVSLGGFGRYVLDGQKQQNYSMMVAGAILVAVLAIIGDRILALIAHFVVSPGLTGRKVRARATTADMLVLEPASQRAAADDRPPHRGSDVVARQQVGEHHPRPSS